MNAIKLLLILQLFLIFILDFLFIHFDAVPRHATWVPDLLAGIILVLATIYSSANSRLALPGRYVIWFLLMAGLMTVGIIANQEQPGAIFYGMRKYFRFLPFILVPLLVSFSPKERVFQVKLILCFALLQLPTALYQRLFIYGTIGNNSGDIVIGTLTGPGLLTIFLMITLVFWTALYLKNRVSFAVYFLLAPIIVLPSWLNDSTAVVVLLPLALILPFLLDNSKQNAFKRLATMSIVVTTLLTAFVITWGSQFTRWGGNISNVFAGDSGAAHYLYKGADKNSRADGGREHSEIGRVDSMLMPFIVLDDPVKWLTGVGIGNASTTFNNVLAGEYSHLNKRYGMDYTSFSILFWEIGILGVGWCLFFLYLVFRDGLRLGRNDHADAELRAIGLTAASLAPFLIVSALYQNMTDSLPIVAMISLVFGHMIALQNQPQSMTVERPSYPPAIPISRQQPI